MSADILLTDEKNDRRADQSKAQRLRDAWFKTWKDVSIADAQKVAQEAKDLTDKAARPKPPAPTRQQRFAAVSFRKPTRLS